MTATDIAKAISRMKRTVSDAIYLKNKVAAIGKQVQKKAKEAGQNLQGRERPDVLPSGLKNLGYTQAEIAFAIHVLRSEGLTAEKPLQDRLRRAIKVLSGTGRES